MRCGRGSSPPLRCTGWPRSLTSPTLPGGSPHPRRATSPARSSRSTGAAKHPRSPTPPLTDEHDGRADWGKVRNSLRASRGDCCLSVCRFMLGETSIRGRVADDRAACPVRKPQKLPRSACTPAAIRAVLAANAGHDVLPHYDDDLDAAFEQAREEGDLTPLVLGKAARAAKIWHLPDAATAGLRRAWYLVPRTIRLSLQGALVSPGIWLR